ncbi:hypothetical protein BJ138DRAFT_1118892 [Hygrophoropsis aurantiaca]|uniref:Uncharacterized protein n=1 Tax=Hygrophoropsis aurantiaca TaxID=72124 RepID=A0ACB7ZV00_9AGAM|nr:hypothetical protein BJ138DRAFT_1118892 [Hygrophoropsis aurantiaca]
MRSRNTCQFGPDESALELEPLVPAVPRVYPSYKSFDGEEHSLNFLHRLASDSRQALLFLATTTETECPRLVKLASDGYGIDPHRMLAARGLAPALYGSASVDGVPPAYVMEYLAPPFLYPPRKSWITLYRFAQKADAQAATRYKAAIRTALDYILRSMEEEGLVHGDLRSNNIMIEIDADGQPTSSGTDGGVRLKVFDFDWGGVDGQVNHPIERNSALWWPAGVGQRIVVGHDREMVGTWFKTHPSAQE